jgi:hypothetical protein
MKTHWSSLLVIANVCLMLVTGCAATPQAAPPTPTPLPVTSTPLPPSPTPAPPTVAPEAPPAAASDIINAYKDAYNRQNADAVLALFVDKDLTYSETGLVELHEKAKIRDYLELSFGVGSVVTTIKDCTAKGDTWHCMLLAHDDCYGAYGMIGDSHNELIVKFTDGKLQQLSTAAAADEMKLYNEAFPKFMAWAQANHPDDWKTLNDPKARPRAVGEAYSRVCKAYVAASQ